MSGKPHWIVGRNVVLESLEAATRKVIQVLIFEGDKERYRAVADKARRSGARVEYVNRGGLERVAGGAAHQGLAAQVFERNVGGFGEWLAGLGEQAKKGCLVVALDEIQDPHNFGAIARSAVCLGAAAIVTPERRSAPITQTVLQASAGAIQKIPVFSVGNLAQTILKLKEAGFWVYGAAADGAPAWKTRLNYPMLLVIGSEGSGMRALVRSYCDEVVSIPQAADGVDSLNASCAASVLLYEAARQKALG